jgi:hypothetical protein
MKMPSTSRVRVLLGLLPSLLLLPACGDHESPVVVAPAPVSASLLAFEDVTARAGLEVSGDSWGLAWGDVDGDGWQDLLSTNHGDATTLHRNQGDGTFELRRIQRKRGDKHGAAWADFDRDGDEDVLLMVGAERGQGLGAKILFVNTRGRLSDAAEEHGLALPELRGRMPVWLDWNRDGELDVLMTCAKRDQESSALYLQRDGSFARAEGVPVGTEQSMFAQCSSLGGLDAPHLFVHGFTYPQVVLDLTTAQPVDVTSSIDLRRPSGVEDVALGDFDGDGATDVFLARGVMGSEIVQVAEDHAYAKLVVAGEPRGVAFRCAGPITVAAFPDTKGWWHPQHVFIGPELRNPESFPFVVAPADAVGEWSPALVGDAPKGVFVLSQPAQEAWSIRLHGPMWDEVTVEIRTDGAPLRDLAPVDFQRPRSPQSSLFVQRGGAFVDATQDAGIERANDLGVAAADFDNDMDLDLFVLRGTPLRNLPDVLYENLGAGRFRAVSDGGGAGGAAGPSEGVGDAVAVADYDQDGFLDLAVTNGRDIGPLTQGPLQLFRNRGNSHHWLRVRLRGRAGLEPIGATVAVEAGGRTQFRTLGTHVHRGAQDERILHFGLASNARADRVTVRWPDGATASLADVAADQVLELVE